MKTPLDNRSNLDLNSTAKSPPLDLETRTTRLAFVFTDISESTRLLDEIGPARYYKVSEEHRRIVRAAIREFGGTEVDTAGDAFFIAFDNVEAALAATVAIQLALASYRDLDITGLPVRIGVHTGEAVRTHEGFVGLNVHRAARISAVAHGGQVIVSEETVKAVEKTTETSTPESLYDFRDLGRHRLKDLSEPQRLFQLIIPGLQNEFPPLLTLEAFPTNLPVQLTPFIGRETDIKQIGDLLTKGDSQVVTLTGPGGMGKTRLALQTAAAVVEQFDDGVFFVGLASLQSADLVLSTVSQTLGLAVGGGQPVADLIGNYMRERHILLVLDNLEQLFGVDVVLTELVDKCPSLKVLATSRGELGIAQESVFAVNALAIPDPNHLPNIVTLQSNESVALFIDRAKAVKPQFELTEANAKAIATICQRLDGLPLAIELAAARVKLFTPAALLDRLSERFSLLSTRARDLPARQQTIQATIEWSYDLLKESDRKLLRRLSVFSGGCTLEAAIAVCDPAEELNATVGIEVLTRHNLVQLRHGAEDERYFLLELIREFGRERLESSQETNTITQKHMRYFLDLIEQEAPKIHTADGVLWSTRIETEFANSRTAFESALQANDKQTVARLIGALWEPWFIRGRSATVQGLLGRAGAMLQDDERGVDPHLLVDAYIGISLLASRIGDLQQSERFAQHLLVLSQRYNLTRGRAWAVFLLGTFTIMTEDDPLKGQSLLEEAAAVARKTRDSQVQFGILHNLGVVYMIQGNNAQAISLFEQALKISKQRDDITLQIPSMVSIGYASLGLDDFPKAVSSFRQALQWSETLKTNENIMYSLSGMATSLATAAPKLATILQARAILLSEETSLPFQTDPGKTRDRTVQQLKNSLTEAEFATAWARGKAMSLEDAISLALKTSHTAKFTPSS